MKTPKLYFGDAGLACHLLGIRKHQELELHSLRGALFENLIFSEFLKRSFNRGTTPNILFFRDKTGHEVDFLLVHANRTEAFEVQSGATFRHEYLTDIHYLRELVPVDAAHLLYAGTEDAHVGDVQVCNAVRFFME